MLMDLLIYHQHDKKYITPEILSYSGNEDKREEISFRYLFFLDDNVVGSCSFCS
jgi:hypothetical protein